MKLFQVLICTSAFVAALGSAVVDPSLMQRFSLGGMGETQNIMVSFTEGIQSVIQQINGMSFPSSAEKRTALVKAQKSFSSGSQGGLQSVLNSMGVKYESFWINNKMIVPNVNSGLVQTISSVPGVAKIEKEPVVKVEFPMGVEHLVEDEDFGNLTRQARQTASAWGIQKIRAEEVWGKFKGRGIVVANIDTGVRQSHVTLSNRWRSSYGWYDPYKKTATPNDDNGHGTHTMGTIAGSNGIGVAPEATWIACKGCSSDSCGGNELFACGQWVLCPTDPQGRNQNCDMSPDVVSNSWGSSGGQTWYDDIISSWQTANIVPVFSIGNSGPNCNTAGSPGDRPKNIAVGSMDSNDKISRFSSLGPARNAGRENQYKPDIAAPGGQIRSAWHTGDSVYNTISGTSMACPHVSGVVALMLQKRYSATYGDIYEAITKNAVRNTIDTSGARTCGGRSPSTFPNHVFGYGRLDAVNAVNAI